MPGHFCASFITHYHILSYILITCIKPHCGQLVCAHRNHSGFWVNECWCSLSNTQLFPVKSSHLIRDSVCQGRDGRWLPKHRIRIVGRECIISNIVNIRESLEPAHRFLFPKMQRKDYGWNRSCWQWHFYLDTSFSGIWRPKLWARVMDWRQWVGQACLFP